MRVVFHIDFDCTPTFELLLGNIQNLLRVRTATVAVVANGYAVKLFTKASLGKYADTIKELVEKGVVFYICDNALSKLVEIGRDDISELCEIIPAGVVKLAELQEKGYAYIKP